MFHVKQSFPCMTEDQRAQFIRRWLKSATTVVYRGRKFHPRFNQEHLDTLQEEFMRIA